MISRQDTAAESQSRDGRAAARQEAVAVTPVVAVPITAPPVTAAPVRAEPVPGGAADHPAPPDTAEGDSRPVEDGDSRPAVDGGFGRELAAGSGSAAPDGSGSVLAGDSGPAAPAEADAGPAVAGGSGSVAGTSLGAAGDSAGEVPGPVGAVPAPVDGTPASLPVAESRPYGRRGGLREPSPEEQSRLVAAVPCADGGVPALTPDPRLGGYLGLLNGDGPGFDGTRAVNSVDCVLSLFDTWTHGRPLVAAPRTFDGYACGEPVRPLDGEADGPGRVEDVTGGRYQGLCPFVGHLPAEQARPAVEHALANLRTQLLTGGHGSFAFVITAWEGGGAHSWAAINQDGAILYLDPQLGVLSEDQPLYGHRGEPYDGNVVMMDALVTGPGGVPLPLPNHPAGSWSSRPPLPDPHDGHGSSAAPAVSAAGPETGAGPDADPQTSAAPDADRETDVDPKAGASPDAATGLEPAGDDRPDAGPDADTDTGVGPVDGGEPGAGPVGGPGASRDADAALDPVDGGEPDADPVADRGSADWPAGDGGPAGSLDADADADADVGPAGAGEPGAGPAADGGPADAERADGGPGDGQESGAGRGTGERSEAGCEPAVDASLPASGGDVSLRASGGDVSLPASGGDVSLRVPGGDVSPRASGGDAAGTDPAVLRLDPAEPPDADDPDRSRRVAAGLCEPFGRASGIAVAVVDGREVDLTIDAAVRGVRQAVESWRERGVAVAAGTTLVVVAGDGSEITWTAGAGAIAVSI